jgi:hypothetical protein
VEDHLGLRFFICKRTVHIKQVEKMDA